MRAVLFRIVLAPFFSVEMVDGMPRVGLGLMLLPWTVIGVMSVYLTITKKKSFASTLIDEVETPADKVKASGADAAFTGGVFGVIPIGAWFYLSSHPEGIPVFGYGVMMFMGILAATLFATYNAKKLGVSSETILDMLMWLVIPGILGGRLFYIIQKNNEHGILKGKSFSEVLVTFIKLSEGGLVFYGAIMGGLLGFLGFCYRRRLNVLKMGDIILPSVFVGLGFGRIGCFLFGCCFGGTCTLPWAVQFPKGSVPYMAQLGSGYITDAAETSLALHPTQIYSSISAFLIATTLILYLRHRPYNGSVLAVGWIIYPIARFIVEILRNDEASQFGTGLTISQNISVILFGTGLVFLALLTATRGNLFGLNKNSVPAL